MKILVINSGSSSIKFQLFDMPQEEVIASGLVERIGLEAGAIKYTNHADTFKEQLPIPNHAVGLEEVAKRLLDEEIGVIRNADEIEIIGHRVVHGGYKFSKTTEATQEVKESIKELFPLAPLHNPANLKGIEVAEEIFPKAKQVAVFDTAFHQSLPKESYTYAIPKEIAEEHHIRVYGFHGISHKYVSEKAVEYLGNPEAKLITLHLGNGCSMTAIQDGQSIDHSLGFGPNDGLVMGTRCGEIDQAVIFYLQDKLNLSANEVATMLSKQSGMLGLTGLSDLRDIEEQAAQGNRDCQLALELNAYRIKKLIGAYTAAMNGVDALVFTAGIGENSSMIRRMACADLDFLGIKIDDEKNDVRSNEIREIQLADSKVKILIIPTNEELEIAKQAYAL